jgi:hypothetical protein
VSLQTATIEARQPIKRMLHTCAVTVAAIGSAGAMWLGGGGTALTLEPAPMVSKAKPKLMASTDTIPAPSGPPPVATGHDHHHGPADHLKGAV